MKNKMIEEVFKAYYQSEFCTTKNKKNVGLIDLETSVPVNLFKGIELFLFFFN